jgi:hypothetical protein
VAFSAGSAIIVQVTRGEEPMTVKGKIMMPVLVLVLVLMLISSACALGPANEPPVAKIDSISPASPYVGDEVTLEGHGVDQDGEVVSFEWRSSLDEKLGESASISTSSLSEGDHIIYFKACDDEGDCSEEAIAQLVVSAKPLEVTAESAAAIVIEKIIEPLNFKRPTLGFKLEETLKPGDTIAAYHGEQQQVNDESYFFFVDLFPGALYAHDVLFVIVNKGDGSADISQEEWWPMINDNLPEWLASEEAYWDESNWFYSHDITPPVHVEEPPPQIESPPPMQYREAAVVVNGHGDGETLGWDMAMSVWRMWFLFDYCLTPGDTFDVASYPIGSDRPSELLALLGEVCLEGYDHITVYIVGHGNIDVVWLGGTPMSVDLLVDFVSAHSETSFSFLLESCHIGSFIDDLSALPNVYLVLTSTSTYFSAYGDQDPEIDPNPDVDSGAEWTSSMYFSALEQLSPENWTSIATEADRLRLPPSVVLLLAAFSNEGTTDGLGLDACYLSGIQFPQAWCLWGPFCYVWQQPPQSGEAILSISTGRSGYVTSSGGVTDGGSGLFFLGDHDSKRAFFSFLFPEDMPPESTVLAANIRMNIRPQLECEPGYLGDFVIEHLDYGSLGAGDFDGTLTEEVARIPVWGTDEGCSVRVTISVKRYSQQDIDSSRAYSQYRIRFTGDLEFHMFAPDLTIYYELR